MLKLLTRSLFALSCLIAAPTVAMAQRPEGTPFADISNVTILPYDVEGRDTAAVRRAIDKARPTDPNDGKRVDALSRYNFRWRWRSGAQGKCSTTLEDVVFTATVTAPRLINGSPKVNERFDRFITSLYAHEDGHIRYAWDHRSDIAAAINSATCATANEAALAAVKTISEHDIAYDKATRHGATTVIPFD
ncbi:DUF922 domain-containing protein [Sphingomonas glacialis]|uniref:DUF922 domain-containing protein n=1 Tax=Sphingomonas glacialis TaxID=658225 RepID=A0A502FXF6_9SPHN|nr:DUF922 domain-containing protein [Sphingomonas glacialis]TPG54164.1 DUF922 domain-containing protein [Sphingomonas glacialis]